MRTDNQNISDEHGNEEEIRIREGEEEKNDCFLLCHITIINCSTEN
jgi:hypothetical protein